MEDVDFSSLSDKEVLERARQIMNKHHIAKSNLIKFDKKLFRYLIKNIHLFKALPRIPKWNFSDEELIAHANKYISEHNIKSRSELEEKNLALYKEIIKRKISDKLSIPYLHRNWKGMSDDELVSYAKTLIKKYNIKTRKQLKEKDYFLVKLLYNRNLIDDLIPSQFIFWSRESDEKILEHALSVAKKNNFTRRKQFEKYSPSLYTELRKRKLIDKTIPLYFEDYKKYSDKELIAEAKRIIKKHKLRGRSELDKINTGMYKALKRRNMLDTLLPKLRKSWINMSDKEIIDYARKMIRKYKLRTRTQIYDLDYELYNQLHKRNLMDSIMPRRRKYKKKGYIGGKRPTKSWFRNIFKW